MGKDKDKKRKEKENGDDDKEAKKAKKQKKEDSSDDDKKNKADKKQKKEKDKEKKKDKKEKDKDKEKASTAVMGKPSPVMGAPVPVGQPDAQTPVAGGSAPAAEQPVKSSEKTLKAWQDDELEVESGDEASTLTKIQTLSAVAAKSLGGHAGNVGASEAQEESDTLDAFMAENAKVQEKQRRESSKDAPGGLEAMVDSGMSVMDSARVKTITLEEINALMSGGATPSASSSSKPEPTQESGTSAAKVDDKEEDEDDDAFHKAFMAQMLQLREGKKAVDLDKDDGSDTGEEWDEARTERERVRQAKREERWKAKDEKAAARAARIAAGEQVSEEEDDDDSEEEKNQAATASGSAVEESAKKDLKHLPKKERRRLRREQKQKESADKEAEKQRMAKLPEGMQDEERFESDAEGSEASEAEKEPESYFELMKRYTTKKTLPQVDHSTIDYKPFTKNLYVQVKEITAMKDHEVDDFRRSNADIRVRGKNCPRPIKTFLQCGLPEKILKLLEKRECEKPFPIQMQVIPALMCGRDIIGVAQTGSGKTLAYILPVVRQALHQLPDREGGYPPVGLIVAPTRELALQIQRECNIFCKAVGITSVCAFGGGPMGEQLSALKKGCEILVGTPGRLIDVLTTSNGKITNLRHVTFLVLDEADRMFDMGFEPQIGMFLQSTRPDKQVAMLSATLPTHVEALARQCLKKPLEITVGERNTAAVNVTQFVEVLEESQKFYRLLQILGEWHEHGSVIIFVHQQKDVDEMFTELLKFGYPALALHGGQDQHDRDFTVQDFKDGVANILVATSVAARGLDVKKVILVVNFKVPDHLEDYIHRIGRTGRAGKAGFAYTFIQPDEGDRAQDMLDALRQCGQKVPEKLKRLCEDFQSQVNRGEAKKRRKWGGFGGKGFKYDSTELSRQQKERTKAKKESAIGEDFASDEEEFKDAFDEDKPLSAAARAKQDQEKEKEKKAEAAKPAPVKSSPADTGLAAAEIAAKLRAEIEAKEKADIEAKQNVGRASADASSQASPDAPFEVIPASGAKKKAGKTEEELEAQAQAMAEEALKSLPEEVREKKLAGVKQKIKEKLTKANEASAENGPPAPPMPPPAPPAQSALMQATGVSVPSVMGAPIALGEQSMVTRSIASLQDGIIARSSNAAAEADERAAELNRMATSMHLPGAFVEELEINDYPQIARQRISAREPLLQIEELTSAKVQVRGQYFASNAKVPEGGRKLYVECVGQTAMAAQKAKYEVLKMVEALAIRTLNIPGASRAVMGTPGRYDPAVGR